MAIVRGTVGSEVTVIKGDGTERCQFLLDVLLEEEKTENDKPIVYSVATNILVTGNPDLTQRIQNLLNKGDEVVLYGVLGYHNSRMKMRISDLSLPDIMLHS